MSMTLVVGLGVVLVSAAGVIPMLFSARPEPATTGTTAGGGDASTPGSGASTAVGAAVTTTVGTTTGPAGAVPPSGIFAPRPRAPRLQPTIGSDDVNIHWWERVRGVAGLLLLVVGLGLTLAALAGSVVFILSLTVLGSK